MSGADIQLLFGVLGGASLSEGSGKGIKDDLDKIIQQINGEPLKIRVALNTEVGGQKSWNSQLQTKLNALSENQKFAIQISKLNIGAGAVTDFKRQLSTIINALNLDKGTSVTVTAEGLGEVKSKIKDVGNAADEAARRAAAFQVQMETFGRQKNIIQKGLNGLIDGGVPESETQRVAKLVEQYRSWAQSIETVRASKSAASDEYRRNIEAESAAILENINNLHAERQAAADREVALFEVQKQAFTLQENSVKKLLSQLSGDVSTDEERTAFAALKSDYEEWAVSIETILASKKAASKEIRDGLEKEGAAIKERTAKMLESTAAAKERAAAEQAAAEKTTRTEKVRMATLTQIENAYRKIDDYIVKNPRAKQTEQMKMLTGWRNELFEKMSEADKDLGTTEMEKPRLDDILRKFREMNVELDLAHKKGKTLAGLAENAYKKFGGWMIVTRSLMTGIREVKQMVANVRALDTAMTELRKVTDETDATYKHFMYNAAVRAKKLGATMIDTISATADSARLGYSLSEASTLADVALVYKNIGDGIKDVGEAFASVISTMKAFGIEASNSMQIVDKFNEVGNNFAISSQGVGEALLRSASALAVANNNLDESIALITAANSVVQNPTKVGRALKTISMYLRAAKTEAEEAGESTEGMAASVSKLRAELLSLTGGKIDIQINEDTFKSTYQIMKELSQVWGELSDITRANIIEKIGGKRNANVVTALLTNFSIAEEALETAVNSAGSALSENEKYLDSIHGKIAQYQAAFESLSKTFVSTDAIKGAVDLGTNVVTVLDKIIGKLGALPPLIGAIASAIAATRTARGTGRSWLIFEPPKEEQNKQGKETIIQRIEKAMKRFRESRGLPSFDVRGEKAKAIHIEALIDSYNKLSRVQDKVTEEQKDWIAGIQDSDSAMAEYLTDLKGAKATVDGYHQHLKRAAAGTESLGASAQMASWKVRLLDVALKTVLAFAVTWAIQEAVKGISHIVHATEEAIERTKELNDEFQSFRDTNANNIKTLKSLKPEFDTLSNGVSEYGENVALSADEYERYKNIVETIIDISPSLSEGYDAENGYLVKKNALLERAIELQEQEYQNRLREITTNEKLRQGIEGYVATYGDLTDKPTQTTQGSQLVMRPSKVELSNAGLAASVKDLFRSKGQNADLSRQILEALGVTDIGAEIDKYTSQNGYYQWGDFWDDYADKVAYNLKKITKSINYADIGYDSLIDFQRATERTDSAVVEYFKIRDELEQANKGVADQLRLVAERNENYADLSVEARSIVDNFLGQFGVEDVGRRNFWGNLVPDDKALDEIRVKINLFIDSLTPEVQAALSGAFDLRRLFDTGDINVEEFRTTVNNIITDLQNLGFDDETIKYLRLALKTEQVDEQLKVVRDSIKDLSNEYDNALNQMSAQDLAIAYKIVSEEGSMTFDELLEKVEWVKLRNAEMVNVLDFSDMVSGLSEAKSGLDGIISAMDRLNEGTAMTKEQLANLALQFPKLLEQQDLFVDGSIDGQKQMLNSFLKTYEEEYDAQLDAKIAELKLAEQVIQNQLEMESEKAALIEEIDNLSADSKAKNGASIVNKIKELNDLQGENYVAMEKGQLVVNEEALTKKGGQEKDYGEQATDKIWKPFGNTVIGVHTGAYRKSLEATGKYGSKLFTKVKTIASNVWSALSKAVKDATTGNWKGISYYFKSAKSAIEGALSNTSISVDDLVVEYGGSDITIGEQSLDDWISEQKVASDERIKALTDFKQRTINAYHNLEALRGLDLTSIHGSAGLASGHGTHGGGHGHESPETTPEEPKEPKEPREIEAYIAIIDKYYDAVKKLEQIQERRKSLEKQMRHAESLPEKIVLSQKLIDVYKKEANAERELMDAKKSTIAANADELRALGFQVDYNDRTNELYIGNLEHLNELTATSAGKYGTLQEATNALRKETEDLIKTTENLNKDNIAAIAGIEDLGYQVLATKKNIIDYIQEIYNSQAESYKKIIDLRKELIESSKEEYDYEAQVAEKVKEIAELQTRVDQLALDNSRAAQAERNALLTQLKTKQEELANTQNTHATDSQLDALDKMAEDYQAEKDNEIKILRDTLETSEDLWTAFYQTMLGENVSIGDSIDAEIVNAWVRAAEAVNQYSMAVRNTTAGGTVVSPVPKYHSGGVVNESNLSKDETLAVLQNGEIVLNDGKQKTLYKIIDFQSELSRRLGNIINTSVIPNNITNIGTLLKDTTQNAVTNSPNLVFSPHIDVAIYSGNNTSGADAEAYGERIANTTIEKLYNAFERRGISNIRSSKLKP